MQANWSLILNILLLLGVFFAIGRMIQERRKSAAPAVVQQPSVGKMESTTYDDIIAVRKITREEDEPSPVLQQDEKQPEMRPALSSASSVPEKKKPKLDAGASSPLMIFLLARGDRQLAGYELLQTLLAAGLRFGEGQLFHRHQHSNGQGPVLCSLAAATESGVFDLQNIGAFSVRGLCLFMQASGNPTIDSERLAIMLDTAKQLSEGLDTYMLDEQRKPLTETSVKRYRQMLNIDDVHKQPELEMA